jgi:CBS domain-containing protein
MEELQQVSRSLGLARTRRIDPVVDHLDAQAARQHEAAAHAGHPVRGGGHTRGQQARHAYSVVQLPEPAPRHPLRTVADVMSTRVLTVQDDQPLQQAWKTLLDLKVGQAPVLNAQGRLVGLLTRAELLRLDHWPSPDQAALVWRALLMQPVAQVMVSPVPGVLAHTDIRRVARVLLDTDLPGLPVVDADDRVQGFVSRSDLLKAVVHDPPLDLWS